MDMLKNYETAKAILAKYKQEHLLTFYDELNNTEKELLINQICQIDFQQIFDLYEASKTDEIVSPRNIEPLPYTVKKDLSTEKFKYYTSIGENAISNQKYAVVTLAGGQRNKAWI